MPVERILIAGATGLIGRRLAAALAGRGVEVLALTRDERRARQTLGGSVRILTPAELDSGGASVGAVDAVVNLAGESLNGGRWTAERKRAILASRVDAAARAVRFCGRAGLTPRVLVNASAVGFYGASRTAEFTEESAPAGGDFLAGVAVRWEAEALRARSFGTRVALARFGVVLAPEGGALPRMVLPYRFGAGGPVGDGRQWVSWVHADDAVGLLIWLLERDEQAGPVNVTAPAPVTMNELGRAIADATGRPHWLPAPAWGVRLLLGERADLVLRGQRVLPQKALAGGYAFRFAEIGPALRDLLS